MRAILLGRRPHSVGAFSWLIAQGHEIVRVVAPPTEGAVPTQSSTDLASAARSAGVAVSTARELYADLRANGADSALGRIDLVVPFLFWKHIKPPLAACAEFGCSNFHPAPLPEYQGLGGYNFGILHRLREWGVTAHCVDEGFDTGPIIDVVRLPFDWQAATAQSLERTTRHVLLELFKDTITKVAMSGWLPTIPNVGGHYYNRADFESAKILGLDSITSDEIDLRTRAFWYPPDDGAYVERAGHRYTLVSHEILCSLAEEGYRTSLDHSFHRHFKDARNAQSDGADGVKS